MLCSGCCFPCFSDQSLYVVKAVPPEHYPRTQQIPRNSVLVYSSSGISDSLLSPSPNTLRPPQKKTNKNQTIKTNSEQWSGFKLEKEYFCGSPAIQCTILEVVPNGCENRNWRMTRHVFLQCVQQIKGLPEIYQKSNPKEMKLGFSQA